MTFKKNLSIRFKFTHKTNDGVPIDITGYSIKIYSKYKDGDIIESSTDNGEIQIINELDGTFKYEKLDLSMCKTGAYIAELEFTDRDGFKYGTSTFNYTIIESISEM